MKATHAGTGQQRERQRSASWGGRFVSSRNLNSARLGPFRMEKSGPGGIRSTHSRLPPRGFPAFRPVRPRSRPGAEISEPRPLHARVARRGPFPLFRGPAGRRGGLRQKFMGPTPCTGRDATISRPPRSEAHPAPEGPRRAAPLALLADGAGPVHPRIGLAAAARGRRRGLLARLPYPWADLRRACDPASPRGIRPPGFLVPGPHGRRRPRRAGPRMEAHGGGGAPLRPPGRERHEPGLAGRGACPRGAARLRAAPEPPGGGRFPACASPRNPGRSRLGCSGLALGEPRLPYGRRPHGPGGSRGLEPRGSVQGPGDGSSREARTLEPHPQGGMKFFARAGAVAAAAARAKNSMPPPDPARTGLPRRPPGRPRLEESLEGPRPLQASVG